MKTPPLISIITVTLNNLDGLKRTGISIQSQDFSSLEWIVVDGNSSDGTKEFLAKTDANWISEPDRGLYDAMNKGTQRIRGEYVIFMNAGDQFHDSQILTKIAGEIHKGADFIYGDCLEVGENGKHFRKARFHAHGKRGMFASHQAMVYRANLLKDLRYDETYGISADYDFTCRFLQKAGTISYIPAPLCRFETGGISQQKPLKGRAEQFRIRKKLKLVNPLTNALIFAGQSVLWNLRQSLPCLYWRVRSSGNSVPARGQMRTHPPRP